MLQICLALFESKINTIKLNLKMYHEVLSNPLEVLSNSPIPTSRYFSNHPRMNTCSFPSHSLCSYIPWWEVQTWNTLYPSIILPVYNENTDWLRNH